jgi:hypothetical protein
MKIVCIYHSIDLDGEIWKDVPNYPYQASNFGRIRSLNMNLLGRNNTYRIKKGIILKQSFDKDGYLRVALKGDTKKSHRIIAELFIDNPNNLPEINHIDGDKTNNKVDNLEWCTRQHNINHSINNNLQATSETSVCSIKIMQFDKNNVFIKEYNSIREAEIETGICNATISKVCRGLGNTAGGYKWKFSSNVKLTNI